jgi:hypothetical protein
MEPVKLVNGKLHVRISLEFHPNGARFLAQSKRLSASHGLLILRSI